MPDLARRISLRTVPLLLALQAVSVVFLWSLNPSGRSGQVDFAIFLAVILVCLSLISYIFRTEKWGKGPSRALIVAGCVLLVGLLLSALLI